MNSVYIDKAVCIVCMHTAAGPSMPFWSKKLFEHVMVFPVTLFTPHMKGTSDQHSRGPEIGSVRCTLTQTQLSHLTKCTEICASDLSSEKKKCKCDNVLKELMFKK